MGGRGDRGAGSPMQGSDPTVLTTDLSTNQGTDQGTGQGCNLFDAYSGNAQRVVTDFHLFGSVGEAPLTFARYSNTRMSPQATSQSRFGRESVWTHSYQWFMRDVADYNGQPAIRIAFPDGGDYLFVQQAANPALWLPTANAGMQINQSGTAFSLLLSTGFLYNFEQSTNSTSGGIFYRLASFADSIDNLYTCTYNNGNDTLLRKVTDASGRWLQFIYQNQALLNQSRAVLGSTPYDQPAGQWHEITVTNTSSFRFLSLFYNNDFHNAPALPVGELEFYDENNALITGTPFGSDPYDDPAHDPAKVFDGDTATYYRYAYMRNGYAGLDLGSGVSKQVSRIRYFIPAIAGLTHVAQAQFVGVNGNSGNNWAVKEVKGSDGRSVIYNYTTFTDPSGWFAWSTLSSVDYPDATRALYSYAQVHDFTRPILVNSMDPRVKGPGTNITYQFDPDTALGFMRKELSGLTGEIVAETAHDAAHKPKAVYPNGRVVKFTYTSLNANLGSMTTGMGAALTFTHDQGGAGYVASMTDPLGRVTLYSRNSLGNGTSVTYPDGTAASWSYDARQRLLSHTVQAAGLPAQTWTYTRDAQGRLTRTDHPDGSFDLWTYNVFGNALTHQLRNGSTESWTYSASGRVLAHTNAAGDVTAYAYDSLDRMASMTNARGHTWNYLHNDRGQRTRITHPDGTFIAMTYDDYGNLIMLDDETGNTTQLARDEFRRITAATDPLGRVTSFDFGAGAGVGCGACNTSSKPIEITLPSGKKIRNTYDLEWRLTSQTAGFGTPDAATTSFQWDIADRLTVVTDPLGRQTVNAYDSIDRLISTTDALGRITSLAYDGRNNLLTITRPDGGIITRTFDIMDRLLNSSDPLGQTTSRAYDLGGRLITLTDARGSQHHWLHDGMNRPVEMIYPDASTEFWTYDGAGNLATRTTRGGQVMTCTYDSRNRQTACDWSDSTPDIARAYDAAGRLLSSATAIATCAYSYDAAGQLTDETQALHGLGQQFTVGYTHDADGNRASTIYPSGQVVAYTYTARNQVQDIVSDGPPPLASYSYNLDGTRSSKALENGTATAYAFDAAYQVLTVEHLLGAASLQRFDYSYNLAGNRTQMIRDSSLKDVYTHQADDQLTGAGYDVPVGGGAAASFASFNFDAVGNRTSANQNGQVSAYTANALNQYTAVGASPFAYDGNGNLTGYTPPPGFAGSGVSWAYSYDAQKRLLSAAGGGNTVQIAYDARNRQVSRTVNGTVTYFIWDGWSLLEERDASGAVTATCTHGAGVDEVLCRTTASGTVYYHHDALGSVTALSDAGGSLVEKYRYDVFGAVSITDGAGLPLTASAYGNRFQFTGREWIAEAGLYDYRNRVYAAEIGRFLQTDPISFLAGDVNLYRYVSNAPTWGIDPNGFGFWGVIGNIITGALSGAASGAATGAGIGAIAGAVGGAGVGAAPGALAGAGIGAVAGAISGAFSAIGTSFASGGDFAPGASASSGAISGGLAGLTGGAAGVGGSAWGVATGAITGGAQGYATSDGSLGATLAGAVLGGGLGGLGTEGLSAVEAIATGVAAEAVGSAAGGLMQQLGCP